MATPIKRVDEKTLEDNATRILNNALRYDAEKLNLEMDLPGFSYSDFSRVGHISFWSVTMSIEVLRRVAPKVIPEMYIQDPSIIAVVASQVIDVDPKLYEDAAIVLPCILRLRPAHVDQKSYSIYTELMNQKSEQQYIRVQRTVGLLDKKAMKGMLLPDRIRNYFDRVKDSTAKPVYIERQRAPDNALKFHTKVLHSDSDDLYHSNQSVYFRYCLDAAANACNDDKLSNFKGDFFRYRVSRAEVIYRRQCLPGDDIEVIFWEDQTSTDTLRFILSSNTNVITTINLKFFPESNVDDAKL